MLKTFLRGPSFFELDFELKTGISPKCLAAIYLGHKTLASYCLYAKATMTIPFLHPFQLQLNIPVVSGASQYTSPSYRQHSF